VKDASTTPYLIRAIWEWCVDNGFTPYIAVKVDAATRVPMEYVRNGEIVLNISPDATRNLKIGNELIQFSARFNGVSREVSVPVPAVGGIFAKENGQGLAFQTPERSGPTLVSPQPGDNGGDKPKPPGNGRPNLQIVK
jgi:stringent starvation protein B